MQNLLNDLQQLLQTDERLVTEGRLVKNKIIELALQTDADLLKMLLKNKTIKGHFFTKVEEILVFDKIKFMRFVANKQFLPDSYTAYKNKIGLIKINDYYDDYITKRNDVVLAWPYKDTVLQGGQTKEDDSRNEIFWNETLAPDQIDRMLYPKVLTNWKKYDKKGEHKVENFKGNENIIIKGNNLIALHSIKKRYAGKIKLIYIDPPYNTGNDSFKYNDNFNHSTWLTFMKNRLQIAKELLRKDGVIFVQCDENEQAYLKVLLDEIFGRENFLSNICVFTHASQNGDGVLIQKNTEAILLYCIKKNKCKIYKVDKASDKLRVLDDAPSSLETRLEMGYTIYWNKNSNDLVPIMDYNKKKISTQNEKLVYTNVKYYIAKGYIPIRPRKKDNKLHRWRWGLQSFIERKNEIVIKEINGKFLPFFKQKGYLPPKNIINAGVGTKHINSIFGEKIFNFPKPEKLIKRIIEISTQENDLVLDFFIGSGTTATVAHKMNRRYIGVEQMDYIEKIPVVRLEKVIEGEQGGISKSVNWQGGGSFIYCELMEYNEKYIDQIIQSENTETLLTILEDMRENAFLNYLFNNKSFDKNIEDFKQLELELQKKFLFELLDKNQLYLNYGEMEDENFTISETDKKLNNQFYKTR